MSAFHEAAKHGDVHNAAVYAMQAHDKPRDADDAAEKECEDCVNPPAMPQAQGPHHIDRARVEAAPSALTALFQAAAEDDAQRVQRLCEQLPPHTSDFDRFKVSSAMRRMVHLAATTGTIEDLPPRLPDEHAGCFLRHVFQYAARHGRLSVVKYLCDLPAAPDPPLPRANSNPSDQDHTNTPAGVNDASEAGTDTGMGTDTDKFLYPWQAQGERQQRWRIHCSLAYRWALRAAIVQKHHEVVRYLCSLLFDRGIVPHDGSYGALNAAAKRGDMGMVRILVEALSKEKVRHCRRSDHHAWSTSLSRNAMCAAARHGHLEVVCYLRKHQCVWINERIKDYQYTDPQCASILVAVRYGQVHVVQYLFNCVNPERILPAALATATEVLQRASTSPTAPMDVPMWMFLWHMAILHDTATPDGDAVLLAAAQGGHLALVTLMCAAESAPRLRAETRHLALGVAARHGHGAVVQHLCSLPPERGANPATHGNAAVQDAAAEGHLDIVQYLCELPLARGVHPGANRNAALRRAVAQGHLDVVRCLCTLPAHRGVDVHSIRRAGIVPHDTIQAYLATLPPPPPRSLWAKCLLCW